MRASTSPSTSASKSDVTMGVLEVDIDLTSRAARLWTCVPTVLRVLLLLQILRRTRRPTQLQRRSRSMLRFQGRVVGSIPLWYSASCVHLPLPLGLLASTSALDLCLCHHIYLSALPLVRPLLLPLPLLPSPLPPSPGDKHVEATAELERRGQRSRSRWMRRQRQR